MASFFEDAKKAAAEDEKIEKERAEAAAAAAATNRSRLGGAMSSARMDVEGVVENVEGGLFTKKEGGEDSRGDEKEAEPAESGAANPHRCARVAPQSHQRA